MNSDQIPEDGISHPLFISPTPFLYKIVYYSSLKQHDITYSSPHEVILNLHCFKDADKIIYLDKHTSEGLFTITVERFKYITAESIYSTNQDRLETLYMRLLLTNHFSRMIPDRGRLKHYDSILHQYLLTIKGGYDIYLTTERTRTILYAKARRTSALHLLSTIRLWNYRNDVHVNHINLPKSLGNRGLVHECLKLELSEHQLRLYEYDPIPEDNVMTKDLTREIIQVLNQLIK